MRDPKVYRDLLDFILAMEDPTEHLASLAKSPLTHEFFPEFPALKMESEKSDRYKDVFTHTLEVVKRSRNDRTLRFAALFHDIAKPLTFRKREGKVSFHYHEVKGAEMTEEIMQRLQFADDFIEDVVTLVLLHLRGHTSDKWTDSAVRRYVKDAGELLPLLQELQRADVSTKNNKKYARLMRKMDEVEARIAMVQHKDEMRAFRASLSGIDIMKIMQIPPGSTVGLLYDELLEYEREHGHLSEADAADYVRSLPARWE